MGIEIRFLTKTSRGRPMNTGESPRRSAIPKGGLESMIGYIWTRESNQDDKEVYSLKSQIDACRQAAVADGVPVTAEREFRVQFSGRDLRDIPELRHLRSTLERNSHEKQRVYCYTQDRLLRGEEAEDIFYLLVEFRHFNAEVKFIRNPLDLTTIAGKIMTLIAGHEASGEIDKIRDRTMRGKLQRIKEGKLPNYGIEKFGYKRIKQTGKAEINPEEWAILQRIKRLYMDEGYGAGEIAELFNAEGVPTPMKLKRSQNSRWWHSTITKLLRDEAYKGTGFAMRWKSRKYNTRNCYKRPREEWIEIPDAYPPLFTPEEWDRLQALIDANNCNRERKSKTPGILRGLAFCNLCEGRLYPIWSGWTRADGSQARYLYYYCQWGARKDGAHPGNYNRVRTEDLDAWAWDEFCEWIRRDAAPGDLEKLRKDDAPERLMAECAEAETAIRGKKRQITNLLNQARDAAPAVGKLLHAELERLQAECAAIKERLRVVRQKIEDELRRKNSIGGIPETREAIVASLSADDVVRRHQALKLFNVRVLVNGSERRFELAHRLSGYTEENKAA
jgi:DNA invertase Pin-like site-specific DNA recombinase